MWPRVWPGVSITARPRTQRDVVALGDGLVEPGRPVRVGRAPTTRAP